MAEVGVLAYPVLLAVMYGLVRLGREERWGAYEWMRLGALALLMGLVVAVQATFALLGFMRSPATIVYASVSLGGASILVGMYLWERWQRSAPQRLKDG